MPGLISKYPLDITGRNPTNLVSGEQQLLLNRGDTPHRVVSFKNGGFYAATLRVYDSSFKLLTPKVDYIATYTHVDASAYTGMEICSAVVILNPQIQGSVILGAQMVGGDFAFSLTVEDDTITYLDSLPNGESPEWGAMVGDYPQWQPGELQEERWERHHYGHLNESIERLGAVASGGNGVAEDIERKRIKQRYMDYLDLFTSELSDHIYDRNRPHAITKHDVGLPLVENYASATIAHAQAGTSLTHYLTPLTIEAMLQRFAYLPLKNHMDHLYTAHSPTAAQLNAYTFDQFNAQLDTKLGITETAVNANGVMGYRAAAPGVMVNFGQVNLHNELRLNLNAANFTTGQMQPARLGSGTPTANTILLGNGIWADFRAIYERFTKNTGTDVYYAGYRGSNAAGLQHISSTYANVTAYPVGTVVIFQVSANEQYIGYTNGASGWTAYNSYRAAIRAAGGWFVLG